jgi:hypothetical protein
MYLDPGFGSMLIQAFIGLIAVAGSSFYLFRQRIKTFFQNRKLKGGGQAEPQNEHKRH